MQYIDNLVQGNGVLIHFSMFCNLSASKYGGALNLINYSNKKIDISHSIFINNKVTEINSHGGSIYFAYTPCIEFTLLCCNFEHNGAHGTSSFYLSNRDSPFPLSISQVTITNEYKIWDYSHMDGFGGNPILFKHNNITKNDVPNYGLVLDYIPPKTHDIVE